LNPFADFIAYGFVAVDNPGSGANRNLRFLGQVTNRYVIAHGTTLAFSRNFQT